MRFLRYILIAESIAATIFILFLMGTSSYLSAGEFWLGLFCVASFILNGYVLASADHAMTESRIGKLFGLWLRAKESELKRRAQPPDA